MTRHTISWLIAATLVALLWPAPWATADDDTAAASTAAASRVIATWHGGCLTQEELNGWLAFRDPDDAATPIPPEKASIRQLAYWKSLAAAARDEKLDRSTRVRLELEAMRHAVLTPALRRRVVKDVTVSDEEVEALRRDHPEAFRRPRKLKLRNIYKRFQGGVEAESIRLRMKQIRQQLLDGASFEELARKESVSQSARRGGTLGWVDPEELPAPVADAVRRLAPGMISQPVEHGGGISIFLCEEVRAAHLPTPDEVRAKLREGLLRQRRRQAWSGYQQRLLTAAPLQIDPGTASAVLELPGYRLGREDAAELVRLRWPASGHAPDAEEMTALLQRWALGVLEARRAVELRLDREPETAATLRWRQMDILAHAELSRRLQPMLPKPTEVQLRHYFEDHRGRYREPTAYDLAVIDFGEPDPAHGEAMLRRAVEAARRVITGELSFAEAARRYSKHPSAAAGGSIGWRTQHQVALWGPTASRAIFALTPGESTDLLHLESGLKMYSLREVRKARDLPFKKVEDRVRTAWLQEQLPGLEAEARRAQLESIALEIAPAAGPPPRVIRWSTATEFESYGFDVYRSPTDKGPFTRLTEAPIPGAGTSDVPHSYRFEDATAVPGTVYYYYVEAISTSGRRRRLTPVRASTGAAP